MEIRKFIVELHPTGKMTWCEYEDPADTIKKSERAVWLSGYRQALMHLNRQVEELRRIKGSSAVADVMYTSVAQVRDEVAAWYHRYLND